MSNFINFFEFLNLILLMLAIKKKKIFSLINLIYINTI